MSTIDLSRDTFSKNLNDAVCQSRDFARTLVIENLPDKMFFIVTLGASYDGNPLEEGEQTFPDDYADNNREITSQNEIVNLLWRNGKVPEWINVQVCRQNDKFTFIELTCCGRFSDREEHIYHIGEGKAPFHVLGPGMPFDCDDDEKFSLYWRDNN